MQRGVEESRRRLKAIAVVGVALLLGVAAAAAMAHLSGESRPAAQYQCIGNPIELFNNWNTAAVSNGGTEPSFSTGGQAYCLISISTYHYNGNSGGTPGTIGLQSEAGTLGPFVASGSQSNEDWTVTLSSSEPAIINGTYACDDSDPSTWSQNSESAGQGFCRVWVEQAQQTTTTTSTSTSTTTTTSSTTSTSTTTTSTCTTCSCAGGAVDQGASARAAQAGGGPVTVTLNVGGCPLLITKRLYHDDVQLKAPKATRIVADTKYHDELVAVLEFDIVIKNTGKVGVSGLTVTDKLPDGCVLVPGQAPKPDVTPAGSGTPTSDSATNGGTQGATNVTVKPGGSVHVVIKCYAKPGTATNTATVSAGGSTVDVSSVEYKVIVGIVSHEIFKMLDEIDKQLASFLMNIEDGEYTNKLNDQMGTGAAIETMKLEMLKLFPKVFGANFEDVYRPLECIDEYVDADSTLTDAQKCVGQLKTELAGATGVPDSVTKTVEKISGEVDSLLADKAAGSLTAKALAKAAEHIRGLKVRMLEQRFPRLFVTDYQDGKSFWFIYDRLECVDLKLDEGRVEVDPVVAAHAVREAIDCKEELQSALEGINGRSR
jgi:hypothetical protein